MLLNRYGVTVAGLCYKYAAVMQQTNVISCGKRGGATE